MTVHRTADIFSRRAALALAGGGAGALLLAACGSGDSTSGASNSASSTGSASEGSGGAGSTAAAGSSPSAASASTETNPGSLRVIVNKMRPFSPKEWEPEDLVDFEGHQLRAEAAEAAKKMMRAAKQEGVELTVSSAYRSYAVQQQTYQHWVEVNGKQKADTLSARPGYSEHQTGLAIDFGSAQEGCLLEECYKDTKAGRWLAEHAPEYGYILRFPQQQQGITGYVFEPWHYRYLGVELAKEYTASGAGTLEEFFGTGAAPNYEES